LGVHASYECTHRASAARQHEKEQGIIMGDRRRSANGQAKTGRGKSQLRQNDKIIARSGLNPVRNICVYCGSSPGINPAYAEAATTFGRLLAEAGQGLVYGGGSLGLMGEVARSAIAHGGRVTGIIPSFLSEKERMLREAHEMIVVEDMHQRKKMMFDRSDAFVALPGGIGTLEELVEQLTWAQLGRHTKPVVLVNTEGFWAPFLELVSHMRREAFIRRSMDVPLVTVDRPEDVLPAIVACIKPRKPEAEATVAEKF
jgi:uncharacterized protein (TIGR00730 family)